MEKASWTAAELLQLSGSYWSACALHAGVKLDVFTHLAEHDLTVSELAEIIRTDIRGLSMLLNSLAALELIEKCGAAYSATPFAAEFLSRKSNSYLGHIILHHHNLIGSWTRLYEAVKTGRPDQERVSKAFDTGIRENFEMGMFNLAMQIAPKLAAQIDLKGRRRLLDLGGGPGTYAVFFCMNNPELTAVVYDLPTTRPFAEETITRFDLGDRIEFMGGDFMDEPVPRHFDVAWLSHILHGAGSRGSEVILEKAVSSLEKGGKIMIQEFILDDGMCSPLYPALFSLNMLLGTPDGRSFSLSEIISMLASAGIEEITRVQLVLPNGSGVITGIVP